MSRKKSGVEREEYYVLIGPLLKQVIDEQIESIKEVTYHSVNPSVYEAGEIIAKKMMGQV